MVSTSNSIGLYGKLNASVLLAITPEYSRIKAAKRVRPGIVTPRREPFSIHPEYRTIAGVKVRMAAGGKQNGPAVLLLNPLPQSILAFDPIWTKLGKHFQLVALDLPGFGRSEGGVQFMTFDAQGRFLEEFVRALDLKQLHIVGPDIGMSAALNYVIHHRHDVLSLFIGDGPGIAPSSNGSIIQKMVDSAFWRLVFRIAGAGAFVEAANRIGYVNYVPNAEEIADYVDSYAGRIGPVTEWFAKYPESLATVDPYLSEIDLPVKLFWGDLDQLLYVDNAHRLHQRLKRSDLHVFKHCGHFSYQDNHEEFASLLIDWVGGSYKQI